MNIFIFLESSKILVTDDLSTKIITKTIFAIHDTIEDFLITARNQLITLGGESLRMCRIPDEVGKVREKIKREIFYIEICIYKQNKIERRGRRGVRMLYFFA